jgi:hypothetical protein
MVATSELLVESCGRPVPERLDPPFPDLRPPEVIQVDPPERERPKPPPDRSRAPAGGPPPRREPATRLPGGPAPEAGRAGVVVVVERRPARRHRVVPSLVAVVAFGVGFGLLMAGREEWGRRRAERDQGCPVMPSCASPGAPGP